MCVVAAATPGFPYGDTARVLLEVEPNMALRFEARLRAVCGPARAR